MSCPFCQHLLSAMTQLHTTHNCSPTVSKTAHQPLHCLSPTLALPLICPEASHQPPCLCFSLPLPHTLTDTQSTTSASSLVISASILAISVRAAASEASEELSLALHAPRASSAAILSWCIRSSRALFSRESCSERDLNSPAAMQRGQPMRLHVSQYKGVSQCGCMSANTKVSANANVCQPMKMCRPMRRCVGNVKMCRPMRRCRPM